MTQEEGGKHVQFDLEAAPQTPKKEAAVLSDASLAALAREVAPMSLKMSMLLNVPTVTLILLKIRVTEKATEDSIKMATEFLLYWKQMRATAKDKDKVSEMERVLKDIGKPEAADIFAERSRENQELTADCFAQ